MTLHDFVFSKKLTYRIQRHVLFWLSRALCYTVALWGIYFSLPIETEDTVSIKSVITWGFIAMHVFFDMAYTYIIVYIFIPRFFEHKKYWQFWVLAAILSAFIFSAKSVATLFISGTINLGDVMYFVIWGDFQESINSFGPPAICALFFAIKMLKNWITDYRQKMILIQTNASTELEILKAQVNPHFLFNTLNNIYYFAINKSPVALVLVNKLSGILHYMMYDCEVDHVSLESELMMIKNYLELQQIRYGDRLKLETKIPRLYGGKVITPLLLIPFVENSFKHGASMILGEPFIMMQIELTEDFLYFTLVNDKPFVEKNMNSSEGIGLSNVKKRLAILYPQNHTLTIDQTTDTFSVKLTLPVYSGNKKEKIN